MNFIVVAGGQGTKVWPYSRRDNPKQFQKIVGDESLFTYNINLLLEKYAPENIFISTKRKYLKLAIEQAPEVPLANYFLEPDAPIGRGPGEGFAVVSLSILKPNEPFMIVQSDDLRIPEDKYLEMLEEMEKLVKRDRKHITGGEVPTYPVLGVDYFQLGKKVKTKSSLEIYEVKKFLGRLKDYQKTKALITKENVVVHTNHCCWYPEEFLDAYKKYKPEWYEPLMQIKQMLIDKKKESEISKVYETMPEGSTEEVTQNVFHEGYVVELPYNWIDIGTWNSLYEYMSQNGESYTDGRVIAIDSNGSLVKSSNKEKLIAVMGLEDMVVVDTEDILLIVPREKADKIKDIHEEIKEKHLEDYL